MMKVWRISVGIFSWSKNEFSFLKEHADSCLIRSAGSSEVQKVKEPTFWLRYKQ